MTVSDDGSLNLPPVWEQKYNSYRKEILLLCQQEHLEDPQIVVDHFFSVEGEFSSDREGLEPSAILIEWQDKKMCIEALIDRTEDLIVFGDNELYEEAIERLNRLKALLEFILEIIPDEEAKNDEGEE